MRFADLMGDKRDLSPRADYRQPQTKRDEQPVTPHAARSNTRNKALRARAGRLISFGSMVWPHMLVRVMLAEQLYRAVSILSGSPYHRV